MKSILEKSYMSITETGTHMRVRETSPQKKMKKKVQDMHDAKTVSFEEHIGGILHGHYEGLERKAQEAHSKISSSNHATMRSSSDTEVTNKRDELVAQSKR